MKYTIDGFQQSKLIKFKINERERMLLSHIAFVAGSSKTIREDFNGKSYIWFNYAKFIDEYPYLEIPNTAQVGEHVKKLEQKGILHLHTERTPKGTFTYVSYAQNFYELISSNPDNYSPLPVINNYPQRDNNPLGFDSQPTRILDQTHSDFEQNGKDFTDPLGLESERKTDFIRAETAQNPSQKNLRAVEQEHLEQEQKKINKKKVQPSAKASECVKGKSQIEELLNYHSAKTGIPITRNKKLLADIERVLSEFDIDQCKQVIDFITHSLWHIDNNQNTLSVIFKPTKFFEKYEKSLANQRKPKPNYRFDPTRPPPESSPHYIAWETEMYERNGMFMAPTETGE
jgi:hypothetical protein